MSELIGTPRKAIEVKPDFVGGGIEPIEGEVYRDDDSVYSYESESLPPADDPGGGEGEATVAAVVALDGADGADSLDALMAGEEDESVEVEAPSTEGLLDGNDVVWDLAIAAAATGKGFDGPFLADLLDKSGPVGDVRLLLAIEVLRLGSKLTGDKMLAVLVRSGFETEAAAARVARDELGRVPNVGVEAVTAMPAPVGAEGGAS